MQAPDPRALRPRRRRAAAALLVAVLGLGVGGDAPADEAPWVLEPQRREIDGRRDDLLTAGLGLAGLSAALPELDDPLQPSWAALRRRAIAQSWRALADQRPDHGFGVTHGPLGDARLAGLEYLALLRDPVVANARFTLWLQIPQNFDAQNACLVVAAASGSRGVFGALPTAAERALQRGCAVAHNDKGLGSGLIDPALGKTLAFDGRLVAAADPAALFFFDEAKKSAAPPPHALLMKHAHSGDNPEARWGALLLRSGEVALTLLNRERPTGSAPLTPRNTLIIAAGISNGGAAALQALEADRGRFFDAAIVGEPNVQTADAPPLFEYATLHGLLQPCAILAEELASIPLGIVVSLAAQRHRDWCGQLAAAGLVSGASTDEWARAARARLLESGILPGALRLGALNLQFGLWPSVGATYASAYARNRSAVLPCRLSFAALDAQGGPRALQARELVAAYTDSRGIAPTASLGLLGETADGRRSAAAAADWATAHCLYELARTPGSREPGARERDARDTARRIAQAIARTRLEARPGQRPVVILHGRDDALIPVAHSSRAYVERALTLSRGQAEVRYFEIDRAQHFDAFLALPGMGAAQPLQPQLNAAFDLLLARLREGRALPPSQRVAAGIVADPAKPITHVAGRLAVPD